MLQGQIQLRDAFANASDGLLAVSQGRREHRLDSREVIERAIPMRFVDPRFIRRFHHCLPGCRRALIRAGDTPDRRIRSLPGYA